MRKSLTTPAATAAVTAVSAGTALARRVAARRPSVWPRPQQDVDTDRWRSVTVLRRIDEIRGTTPPALAALGSAVEVDLRPAPDGKGCVLAAHVARPELLDPDPTKTVHRLRTALRHAKQQLEIGWVVTPTRSPVVETPLNKPLREAEAHAQGEGVR